MKHGYWIPISKGFKKALPHDREYTELEAAYSLQLDCDCENTVTVAGYSDLWRWSRKRVYRFLERMNIKIMYPENTTKKRNQRGFLGVHKAPHKRDIKGTYKEHIRLIENNNLEEERDIKGAKEGHKRDIKGSTTIEPKEPKILKPTKKDTVPPCPQKEIINLYHEILPSLPMIEVWPKDSEKQLRMRWREDPKRQFLENWGDFFLYVKKSEFLMGANDRAWTADLFWLVGPKNFAKVLSGKYHRNQKENLAPYEEFING